MFNRRQAKKDAKKNVRSDYVMFVIACLIASFLGSAYSSTLTSIEATKTIETVAFSSSGESVVMSNGITADSVLSHLYQGQIDKGKYLSDDLMKQKTDSGFKVGSIEFGRTKGILSDVVNRIASGKVLIYLFQTIMSVTKSQSIATSIFIVLVSLVSFAISVFIRDTYKVAFRRIFLEGHNYDHVKIARFLFLFRIKKYFKATYAIFITSVYQFLWDLTIIGGIIKRYSYYMVPYIVAENPDINAKDAIRLSCEMMHGHKFELFKIELSFIGWWILGSCTFGLSQILFSNPYEECTYCAFYVHLRELAKESKVSYVDNLNDIYLYEKADTKLLEKTYADVIEIMNDDIEIKDYLHTGKRGFIENNFGIIYRYDEEEDKFNEAIEQEEKIKEYRAILKKEQYPGRLFPIAVENRDPRLEHSHYLRHYSIWSLIAMFFIFCFIGWAWEVSLHIIKDGMFINRGTMHGPWLPIYGFGCTLILIFLYRFRNKPGLEAFLTIVLCGTVEYFTHWFLEITKHTKWWDYSGYFLNINGRICAEGLLVFMLGGLAVVYALGPLIDNYLRKVDKKILKVICVVLLVLFSVDSVYSYYNPNVGKGITDYDNTTYSNSETYRL